MTKIDDAAMDWPQTEARFREVFGDLPRSRKGLGIGVNFITNEVLGTFELPSGALFEVSTGMFGIEGSKVLPQARIFGVTVRPDPDEVSTSVGSLAEARAMFDRLAS